MNDNDFEIIERCRTPRGEMQLQRRGTEYEIISNGIFLMATYNGESEKMLVRAALDACGNDPCTVLIGGLGVGYSLAEAVASPRTNRVTVVEIEKKIVDWNRSRLAVFSDHAIDHEKTTIVCADLLQWMAQTRESFDVVCLDIDNGPDWTVFQENASLYGDESIQRLVRLLKPGGVISFWSASPSPTFSERLNARFTTVTVREAARERGLEPDVIYIARGARRCN